MTPPLSLFNEPAVQRLEKFLFARFGENGGQIQPLTPDASTREYFRIDWHNSTAIACVYPESFTPAEHSFVDVTNLFLKANLPVAEIYETDGALGVIVHEDFGDRILRGVLQAANDEDRDALLNKAISLIARIQAATAKAYELDSIAARLAFDFEKLSWELDFFTTHYFESLRQKPLSAEDAANLKAELDVVATELSNRPRVLTHRDFHAANLMVDAKKRLRIIDHQDARMGPASYDLVSLLLDRISEPPSRTWIREKRLLFLEERNKLALPAVDPVEFAKEFRLMTIQRCLKAIGTFSFQTGVRHRPGYTEYIEPMFRVVLQACEWLERFPALQKIIKEQL